MSARSWKITERSDGVFGVWKRMGVFRRWRCVNSFGSYADATRYLVAAIRPTFIYSTTYFSRADGIRGRDN